MKQEKDTVYTQMNEEKPMATKEQQKERKTQGTREDEAEEGEGRN